MGRRRLWIIVGTILALAVLVIGLALPQQHPLRFLDAYRPVPVTADPTRWGYPGASVSAYSFEGDFDHLVESADASLQGMERPPIDYARTARVVHHFHWLQGRYPFAVHLYKDRRIVAHTPDESGRDGDYELNPGWVTVVLVAESGYPSLWDRIKAVFGL